MNKLFYYFYYRFIWLLVGIFVFVILNDTVLHISANRDVEVVYFDGRQDTVKMKLWYINLNDGCLTALDREQLCGISKARIIE